MSNMDVVYIVGPGNDEQPELRLSLRSVAANFPHRNVWIVGHKPTWVRNVGHIPTVQSSRIKYVNALRNITAAATHPDVSSTFVLFNDDFYANKPNLPTPRFHRGTIRHMLATAHKRQNNSDYVWGMRKADEHLRELGVDDPLSYELHMPMTIQGAAFADILGRYPQDDHMVGVAKRSIYGNLAGIGGTQIDDVRPARHGFWDWAWISTNDDSAKPGTRLRTYLDHKHPRPCWYEDYRTAPTTNTRAWINTATSKVRVLPPRNDTCRALDQHPDWLAI